MTTFETISTPEATLPFSTQKKTGEEKTTDAGFLAMLAQMFFGTAEQKPSVHAANQLPVVEAVPVSVPQREGERNRNTSELSEHAAYDDGVSSFHILPTKIASNDIRRERTIGEAQLSVPRGENPAAQHDAAESALPGESQRLQRPASRLSIPEGDFGDEGSSFEIIATIPARPARQDQAASHQTNVAVPHLTATQRDEVRPIINDRVIGNSTASPFRRTQLNGLPSFVVDDIIHWDKIDVRVAQKPERLEAYMKVSSELRAVADKFSLGITTVNIQNELMPSPSIQHERQQPRVQNELANESLGVENPSTANVANKSEQNIASDQRQPTEKNTTPVVAMNQPTEEKNALADRGAFDFTDQDVVVAQPAQSERTKREDEKSLPLANTERTVAEHVVETKHRREDVAAQQTRNPNEPAREAVSSQPTPRNMEATGHFVRDNAAITAAPLLPEDFSSSLMMKVMEKFRLHLEGKSEGIRVVLKPETLGELTIRATMEEGKLTALIRVQQPEVKAALEAQTPQLRETLAAQGIDVHHVEIVSDGGEMRFYNSDEGRASHQRPTRFRRSQKNVDVVEELNAGRSLGYNTIEYII